MLLLLEIGLSKCRVLLSLSLLKVVTVTLDHSPYSDLWPEVPQVHVQFPTTPESFVTWQLFTYRSKMDKPVLFFMFGYFLKTCMRIYSMQILSCQHSTDGLGNTEWCRSAGPRNLWEVWADLMHKTVKDCWTLHDRCASSLAPVPLNKAILISKASLKNIQFHIVLKEEPSYTNTDLMLKHIN